MFSFCFNGIRIINRIERVLARESRCENRKRERLQERCENRLNTREGNIFDRLIGRIEKFEEKGDISTRQEDSHRGLEEIGKIAQIGGKMYNGRAYMMHILSRLLILVVAIMLVAYFVPGITVASIYTAFIVAIVLGVLNLTIKPILVIVTLPINIVTFGLFTFVINALLFWFVSSFVEGFAVSGFIAAFVGALVISVVSWFGHRLIK